jgi:hypothetical protein
MFTASRFPFADPVLLIGQDKLYLVGFRQFWQAGKTAQQVGRACFQLSGKLIEIGH